MVFGLGVLHHLEDHWYALVLAKVISRSFTGRMLSQDSGLVQGDITDGFTLGGEVELSLFLALVFGHGGIVKAAVAITKS